MIQFVAGFTLALAVPLLWKFLIGRERAEGALRESEARFRAFMDNSPAVSFIKDSAGRYLYLNGPLGTVFNVRPEELKGRNDFDWLPEETARRLHANDLAVISSGAAAESLEVIPSADGTPHSWLVVTFPFRDSRGRRLVGGIAVDVTEQELLKRQVAEQLEVAQKLNSELAKANARLSELATTDGLTGLWNHRCFCETLETQFSAARRQQKPLSVAMVDVDLFKPYNDAFGHQRGDEALAAVASALQANSRGSDLVARYGGEEFALILPATDAATALLVCERLRAAIERRSWPLRPVTVSIGIATSSGATRSTQQLVQEADKALYDSKDQGRNRVTHYDDLDTDTTLECALVPALPFYAHH